MGNEGSFLSGKAAEIWSRPLAFM